MSEGKEKEPGFGEALAELEATLERVEGDDIDIDRLADELRRAAELLEICRGKIRRAEAEVSQIVQKLERDEPRGEEGGEEAEDGGAEDGDAEDGDGPEQDGLF